VIDAAFSSVGIDARVASADYVDCIVIGAGVIGLAIARELALAGREVLVLERHAAIGTETSSRNSEVVHAGLHYPKGSLKAHSCVRGRELLYEYCAHRGIPHRRCGKLIVATNENQLADLERIAVVAAKNGVTDLVRLDRTDARALEPELECVAALLSPSTGIVDSHALMLALLGEAEQHGASLALQSPVERIRVVPDGLHVLCGDEAATQLRARWVVNAAGLGAVALANRTEGLPPAHVPKSYLAKGSYFSLGGRAPFSRLVYPVPEPGGLGVHLTLDLGGQARFGPDVEWVDSIDYAVDPVRAAGFEAAIHKYWPGITGRPLSPAYSGMRPKIVGPGALAADFRVDGPETHGVPGLVNLFGIESPGLTACLAIAEDVARRIDPS
jgi:L-2-hydroxyglutarate oxidase LhgO